MDACQIFLPVLRDLTGHTVFSTIHTNDAPSTITRLVDMGIQPFLISATLEAVVAQRLVRRLCPECREPGAVDAKARAELGLPEDATVWRAGPGCEACKGSGYQGRTGIHELLVLDDDYRQLIMDRADASALRRLATSRGVRLLREDGAARILDGTTSAEEVLRVTQED